MSIGGPAFLEYGETRRRLESSSSFVNVPLLAPSRAKGKEIDYDEWVIRHDAANQSRTGQKRFWWLAGLILLLGALIGAVVVGSFLSVSATRDANFSPDTKVKGDPSSFDKDSRFHKSFAGICYSPTYSSFYPECGDSLEDVVEDIQILSQLTDTIRLYGADCATPELVLEAIKRTKTDLKVYLGIYVDLKKPDVYSRQLKNTLEVLEKYGDDHVLGVTVGNEVMLNAKTENGTAGVKSATQEVISLAQKAKKQINAVSSLKKQLPVGTGEAGTTVTEALGKGVDYVFVNVQAFFGEVTIDEVSEWTHNYMENDQPSVVQEASNHPASFYGEVGWPSSALPNGSITLNGSIASVDNLQQYLDDFVCDSNEEGTQYFWFQSFDADWTAEVYGGPEPFWGLFDSSRDLKDGITIPQCSGSLPDMTVDSKV